jgi:pyridoxal biosynthesis lyase PdxS
MTSIVCTKDIAETGDYSLMQPDFLAIEPPELIGSGISVSTAKPEVVSGAVKAAKSGVPVLCGAGVSKGIDVQKALELGAKGVLLASGVVKAQDPKAVLMEMAKSGIPIPPDVLVEESMLSAAQKEKIIESIQKQQAMQAQMVAQPQPATLGADA